MYAPKFVNDVRNEYLYAYTVTSEEDLAIVWFDTVTGSGLSKGGKKYIMAWSNYMTAGKDVTYRITDGRAKAHNLYHALKVSLENLGDSITGNQQVIIVVCDGRNKL